jgi:multiple sugar transport system substrate-binding protein
MRRFLILFLVVILMGCTGAPPAAETPLPDVVPTPTETPLATPVTTPDSNAPITLRIWVPPRFDPSDGSAAGALFQSRLDEFAARKTNIQIDVRVKNVDGPGGILDTLATSSAAAPLALPDLVILPRYGIESATHRGLLHPFDGLTTILDDPDWYNFARQLSHLQNTTYGIPLAGDALLMTYRPEVIAEPPADWPASLLITNTLTFPAADPQALFTFLNYQSLGGAVTGEAEQPAVDDVLLTDVLTYYQQASASELMPFWLTQYESDQQAWEAYEQEQADLAITWVSRYLELLPEDTAAAPVPTFDGTPFTLADGWAWALTAHDAERQSLAAQLAEFLSTSEYLASWTEAAGLIPPRPSSLETWESAAQQALLNQIVPTAQLSPSQEVIDLLGPALQAAVISVLKAEEDATTAAQTALEKLSAP